MLLKIHRQHTMVCDKHKKIHKAMHLVVYGANFIILTNSMDLHFMQIKNYIILLLEEER